MYLTDALLAGTMMDRMKASGDFDPETLRLLQEVLDQVWASIPPERRVELAKSEMAQRILRRAAEGERDPVKLRAAARIGPV